MNRKLKGCVLALAALVAPGMAIASNAQVLSAHELAQLTGVHERQVQMVFGARSQYAEYKTGAYDFASRKIADVLGEVRYNDLMAGREIRLDDGRLVSLAAR